MDYPIFNKINTSYTTLLTILDKGLLTMGYLNENQRTGDKIFTKV